MPSPRPASAKQQDDTAGGVVPNVLCSVCRAVVYAVPDPSKDKTTRRDCMIHMVLLVAFV